MANTATLTTDTVASEKLDILIEAVDAIRQELTAIRLRLDAIDEDNLDDPMESLRISLQEAQMGLTYPVDTLWDDISSRLPDEGSANRSPTCYLLES